MVSHEFSDSNHPSMPKIKILLASKFNPSNSSPFSLALIFDPDFITAKWIDFELIGLNR